MSPVYRILRLESWDAFLKAISASPYANWAFRGERHANWPLFTALSRYFRDFGIHRDVWAEQEERILRIFKRKAHQYLNQPPDFDDDFQWLALMQHYGAPTRLLDFTWSPYVAAFFALERTTAEAAVWALNSPLLRSQDQSHPALARNEIDPRLKGNFKKYFLKGDHSVIWVGEPDTMNRRLIAQSGTFVLPGVLDVPIEEILIRYAEPENMVTKFVLEADRMRDIAMRELYRMNITYSTVFPDLEGLARSMAYELEFHWAYNPRSLEQW